MSLLMFTPALFWGCKTEVPPEVAAPDPALMAIEADVVAAMDKTVDPCVDFYAYACGGWAKANPIPDDEVYWSRSFNGIDQRNQEAIRALLEAAAANPGDDPDLKKVGAFYSACMDTDAIEAAGITPLKPLFDAIDGITDLNSLMRVIGTLNRAGISPFFAGYIEPDYKNPNLNSLTLLQGGLSLPDRDYYLASEGPIASLPQGLLDHITASLVLTGLTEAQAQVQAKQVLDMELALAKASWARADLRDADKTYNKLDRAGLKRQSPSLPWDAFFASAQYPGIQNIVVATPPFFTALDQLLVKADLNAVKSYLRWHTLHTLAPYLTRGLDEAHFEFYGKTLSGAQTQRPRWKRCVRRTNDAMGEVLGKAYVAKYFAGDSKAVAVEMITNIEAAFAANLANLSWMDDQTRAAAIAKKDAIINKIGYPDTWTDYSSLNPSGVHASQVLAANAFTFDYWMKMADQPVDKGLWYMNPQDVNAYYNPLANEIAFPAGILQPPFFSASFPKAMNYGAIGAVMGHEITHGFDDEGRKFSPTGAMEAWWAAEAATRFEEQAACVDDQYDAFEAVPGVMVDGALTLGENIADLGGVKQSYTAYTRYLADHGRETSVAGLSPEQLFFVSYAQAWCSHVRPEMAMQLATVDPHSPPRYRVNGPLSNLRAFGEHFSCAPGTPMQREQVCEVW